MIVSASYRTDIPSFYAPWFLARLEAGHCKVLTPYRREAIRVSLRPEDISGFVFWTRNLAPFFSALEAVRGLGKPFVVQHTITGYPRLLEAAVADEARAIDNVHRAAELYGRRTAVWRYDPIVFSSLTPRDFHLENFARLAGNLSGAVDEVVVSFAQIYRKTERNLKASGTAAGFDWWDPDAAEKRSLLRALARIARGHGMTPALCAQREYLVEEVEDAHCIDPTRLSDLAARPIFARPKAHRERCGCFESRDIGDYDTCPAGCAYCYAVVNREKAQARHRRHDPSSEFLFEPELGSASTRGQLPLLE